MASLTEPSHPHLHTGHLEFESVNELPDSHTWPTIHDHPTSESDFIPVIDLSDPNATTHLARACETWGAFQLTGHGVAAPLLDRLESQLIRLFSLPIHQKLKAARSPDGISGYGCVPISSSFSKLMWSEGFTIVGSLLEHAGKLWPDDQGQFCDVIEEYEEEMKGLARRLMRLMLLSLGLDEVDMKWAGPVEEPRELAGAIRLNSYPVCPDPERAMGMAPHTDSSLITVLCQTGTSGLQVLLAEDRSGPSRWVTVPLLPGSLIVILGDLFHILSNGRFKSAFHRAVVNRIQRRLSAAYFCGPPAHVKVSPARKLVDLGRGPCYRAVTWPEYRDIKAKLFQEALNSLKESKETYVDGGSQQYLCYQ